MLQKKDRETHNVKCVMCYKVTRKDLIFVAKSNTFKKHACKKKATKDLPHLGSRKILGLLMSSVGFENIVVYMSKSQCTILE